MRKQYRNTRLPNHQHQKNCNMAEIYFKFVPNDIVWVMQNNVPVQRRIISVNISINANMDKTTKYVLEGIGSVDGAKVYETKKELKEYIFG